MIEAFGGFVAGVAVTVAAVTVIARRGISRLREHQLRVAAYTEGWATQHPLLPLQFDVEPQAKAVMTSPSRGCGCGRTGSVHASDCRRVAPIEGPTVTGP